MSEKFFNGIEWPAKVKYSGEPMRVAMSFASGEDMERISSWADADHGDYSGGYWTGLPDAPDRFTQDQRDILEYVTLLDGMYQTYDLKERFADSVNRLERIIQENPREDVLFTLVLKALAATDAAAPFAHGEILGFAAMRRTWKNTVKMEFLAANPSCMEAGTRIRGVGKSLLIASVSLSAGLSAPMFWAESSDTSLGFYLKRKFKALEEIVYLDSAGIAEFIRESTRRPSWYFQKT
jgi:hypothetical protein